MREQARKQAAGQQAAGSQAAAAPPSPVPARATQRQPVVLGPVSAEENRPISADRSRYMDRSIPLASAPITIYQDRSQPLIEEAPEAIRPLMESAKRRKKKKQAEEEEVVTEIVPVTSSIGMQNYEKADAVQTRFAIDNDSLRNYVVIREVLGPPRSRKPYLPGIKNRE